MLPAVEYLEIEFVSAWDTMFPFFRPHGFYIFTTITRILKALGQSGKNPGISDQGISGTDLLVMQRKNMICVIDNFNWVSERMVLFFYA